ncbi:coiled-coil domain-containing protein [Desulfosoma caldarium]|uniref:Uncharacterized protein n=1 Tax=Desulfosoma caldarium TaxID=610254 RepID=A0A3N1VML5_9BACT|nr:hypothetical protein [Desulfosoma caldarium]ROR03190.1 hypothetical protein EDC27_0451 [Desulfosoma caldarium]
MTTMALLKKVSELDAPLRDVLTAILEEVENQRRQWEQSVTRSDFDALKDVVQRLAAVQERTEQRLEQLTEAQLATVQSLQQLAQGQQKLTEAQERTEKRLEELALAQERTEKRVEELALAQERTEKRLDELSLAQQKLTEAQERTDKRLEELALAQQRTEKRVDELALAQQRTEKRLEELALAQQRTEKRVEELALAQQRTEKRFEQLALAHERLEQRFEELAEAQQRTEKRFEEMLVAQARMQLAIEQLAAGLGAVRQQVGGLARSVGYALENEAYRHLPDFLKAKYGIEVLERIVRAEIEGREVNLFGRVRKDGQEMHLVGESVLRLDDRSKLTQLQETVDVVEDAVGGPVIPVLVTHFAKKDLLEKAEKRGMIVIQSFEW